MDQEHFDDERARAVWLRAAQLQAEAARRLEERSRLLAGDADGVGESDGPGLTTEAVRSAAIEAGIAPEFVDLALAESHGSLGGQEGLQGWKDRSATRLLGTDARRLEVTRTLDGPPARILEAMQQVLPNHPYLLSLRDTIGEDPLDGAVLVFDVPTQTGLSYTGFQYKMSWSDLKELRFVLRPVAGGSRTEVLVSIPLERSRRINWWAGQAISGASGLVGGLGGMFAAKVAALTGAAVAGPIAVGALGLAAAGSWVVGKAYRWGLGTGESEVLGLLRKLEVTARMGATFMSSPKLPPTGGSLDPGDLL